MNKGTSSIVCQMRMSKIGLRSYLITIKAADTSTCRLCGYGPENLSHLLYDCYYAGNQRRQFFERSFLDWFTYPLLNILSTVTLVVKAAYFIKATKLLAQFNRVAIPYITVEA